LSSLAKAHDLRHGEDLSEEGAGLLAGVALHLVGVRQAHAVTDGPDRLLCPPRHRRAGHRPAAGHVGEGLLRPAELGLQSFAVPTRELPHRGLKVATLHQGLSCGGNGDLRELVAGHGLHAAATPADIVKARVADASRDKAPLPARTVEGLVEARPVLGEEGQGCILPRVLGVGVL
jgi:hypothetical protein